MEEKVYGYNIGCNEENYYINLVNIIMKEYETQSKQVLNVVNNFNKDVNDISKNNKITDEQIRIWYNEDYSLNNSLVSFERYKESILEMIKKSNFNMESQLPKKLDEYYANNYYLINIKNNTKNKLNRKNNELELILLEHKNQLDIISFDLTRKKSEYDQNGNVINSSEFIELRNKYDNIWIEIRKIKDALIYLKEMFKKVDLKQDEIDLLNSGLSVEQQEIYEKVVGSYQLDEVKNNKQVNKSSKKAEEIKEIIDYLKSIKKDLTEEEIKEIEFFLK